MIPEPATEGGAQRPFLIYQTQMNQNLQELHLRNIALSQILAEISVAFAGNRERYIVDRDEIPQLSMV